jgi:Collagen triple helix repeat (20 copies)
MTTFDLVIFLVFIWLILLTAATIWMSFQAPFGGYPGNRGSTGAQGGNGPFGEAGFPGDMGVTGTNGLPGPYGPTPQINHGVFPTGASGPTGNVGPQGIIGPTGIDGIAAFTGATGYQGASGPMGETGLIGAVGCTGVTGSVGVVNNNQFVVLSNLSSTIFSTDPVSGIGIMNVYFPNVVQAYGGGYFVVNQLAGPNGGTQIQALQSGVFLISSTILGQIDIQADMIAIYMNWNGRPSSDPKSQQYQRSIQLGAPITGLELTYNGMGGIFLQAGDTIIIQVTGHSFEPGSSMAVLASQSIPSTLSCRWQWPADA